MLARNRGPAPVRGRGDTEPRRTVRRGGPRRRPAWARRPDHRGRLPQCHAARPGRRAEPAATRGVLALRVAEATLLGAQEPAGQRDQHPAGDADRLGVAARGRPPCSSRRTGCAGRRGRGEQPQDGLRPRVAARHRRSDPPGPAAAVGGARAAGGSGCRSGSTPRQPIELDIKSRRWAAWPARHPHRARPARARASCFVRLVLSLAPRILGDAQLRAGRTSGRRHVLGLDLLPHTSAVITNLATRPRWSAHGRPRCTASWSVRQELLRSAGG